MNIPPGVLDAFAIDGKLLSVYELKRGHINHTYVGVWECKGREQRFVHQQVNREVFRDVKGLMGNVQIVTDEILRLIRAGETHPGDVTLTVVSTREGAPYVVDVHGEFWRTFEFIENTCAFDVCPNLDAARESAAILGRFHRYLTDVPVSSLVDTIPHFLDGERRILALDDAIARDASKRVKSVRAELDWAHEHRDLAGLLIKELNNGTIPLRVTHNDMKLNNVLFSDATHKAVCLVDLDTCMPGTVLFDFGDLVRNTAVPSAEDEVDLTKVRLDLDLYKVICEGYLKSVGAMLTTREKELLSTSPRVLALVLGVRFLTDHLNGDVYFRIHRPNQNLDRARTQFRVAELMGERSEEMGEIAAMCLEHGAAAQEHRPPA